MYNLTHLSDEEIISEVISGNKEYFSEILKRYNQRLYRVALSFGIQDDDCEEVMQLAYIAAYEKLQQFRGEAKFSTWLIKILVNECLQLKRKKKKSVYINEESLVTIPAGDHLNPQEVTMDKERKEILENAIEQLPEKYKSVYILKEIEGMSISETADALTISKVNVKVRLHRAKNMLKDALSSITDVSNLYMFGNERCDRLTNRVIDYILNKK